MLNAKTLEMNLKQCFEDTLPVAIERAMLEASPTKSKEHDARSKKYAQTITDMVAATWAERIASAIDNYIKAGVIKGTILTTGSPFTQQAVLMPINLGNPAAGSVPNTLGIM